MPTNPIAERDFFFIVRLEQCSEFRALSFSSLFTQVQSTVGFRRPRKQYSDDTKRAVYAMLLEGSAGGHLPEGLSLQVSSAMGVSLRCVQRIWNEGQKGGGVHAIVNKRAKNCRERGV
jgi:hypothetical protein